MHVLITGAAGFLGSHLCEFLLEEGHSVTGMDNFITGNPENIAPFSANERFSFIKHDVSEYIFIPKRVDAVLHFASPASPNPASPYSYPSLPIQTMKAGALGTHKHLGLQNHVTPNSCWPPQVKSMVIHWNTHKKNLTGVTRIQSAFDLYMMKPNGLPKL